MTTIVLNYGDQRIEGSAPEAEETVFRGVDRTERLAGDEIVVTAAVSELELVDPAED